MGRYYAMDRDKRWDRVQRAYDAIALGEGIFEEDPAAAVQKSYDSGVTDEFMEPVVCAKGGSGPGQRLHHLLQLPPRPGPGDHPLLCG